MLTGGGLSASEAAVGVVIILGLSVTESCEERTAPRLGHTGGPCRRQQCGKAGFSEMETSSEERPGGRPEANQP